MRIEGWSIDRAERKAERSQLSNARGNRRRGKLPHSFRPPKAPADISLDIDIAAATVNLVGGFRHDTDQAGDRFAQRGRARPVTRT